MNVDADLVAKLVAPILSIIIGAIVKFYIEARPKVVSYIGHTSEFTLKNESQTIVRTHSVIVHNTGRKAARNVRLSHFVLPPDFTIQPPIQYSIESNPEGFREIVIPVLIPKEQITISYLYFPSLVWNRINQSTKSDEGFAKIVNVIPMPQPSRTVLAVVWLLMFAGVSFILYLLVKFAISQM